MTRCLIFTLWVGMIPIWAERMLMKMKMKTSILDIPFTNSPVSKVSEITTQLVDKIGHVEKASCLAFKSCRMTTATAANCRQRCTGPSWSLSSNMKKYGTRPVPVKCPRKVTISTIVQLQNYYSQYLDRSLVLPEKGLLFASISLIL